VVESGYPSESVSITQRGVPGFNCPPDIIKSTPSVRVTLPVAIVCPDCIVKVAALVISIAPVFVVPVPASTPSTVSVKLQSTLTVLEVDEVHTAFTSFAEKRKAKNNKVISKNAFFI
jgi:hypothetical protein